MCIDYRMLNKVTIKDLIAPPGIDTCLDQLINAKYINKIDLKWGYW